jgi:hypothetical protein
MNIPSMIFLGGKIFFRKIIPKLNFYTIFGLGVRVIVMVFNATFNNLSAISQWSVLLVEETRST